MRRRERRWLAASAVAALPLSQLGHAVAYWLRGAPQSSGVHAYFPSLFTLSGALLGLGLLLTLGVICLARRLGSARRRRPVGPTHLFLVLATLQLLAYLVQEAVELGTPGPATLAWGLAGQLPVAALAAVLSSYLSARLEPALVSLALASRAWAPLLRLAEPALGLAPVWLPAGRLLAQRPPGRAPPPSAFGTG